MANENEIRITGIPESKKKEIVAIAAHMGTSVSQLLKPKLYELVESYPKHVRQPPEKD